METFDGALQRPTSTDSGDTVAVPPAPTGGAAPDAPQHGLSEDQVLGSAPLPANEDA